MLLLLLETSMILILNLGKIYKKGNMDVKNEKSNYSLNISYITNKYDCLNIPYGWKDFLGNSSGYSTTWVTASIFSNIYNLLPEIMLENFRQQIRNFSQSDKGVGYSLETPSDCDSTTFFLKACFALNINIIEVQEQVEFILNHQCDNGGFRTYLSEGKIKKWKNDNYTGYHGWTSDHICVSSAVLDLFASKDSLPLIYSDQINNLIAYLAKKQKEDGHLDSYWWHTKYYSTVFVLNALLKLYRKDTDLFIRGKYFVINSFKNNYWTNGIDDNPCVFSTALCLDFLLNESYFENKSLIDKGIDFLHKTRDSLDNCWVSNPVFKIPYPNSLPHEYKTFEMNGNGVGTCSNDPFNLYTTSLVLKVFNKYLLK